MKRYNFFHVFSWNRIGNMLKPILLLMIGFVTIFHGTLNAQVVIASPCSCLSWTSIGTTGHETNVDAVTLNPGTCYLVKGTLVINVNTTWTGMKLKMEESSMIRVETYLSMSNSYLSGCGDMWQGIHTKGQVYLHSYNSFIEDAEFGMKVSGLAGLVCFGTDFINNYIGIATANPCEEDTEDKIIHRGQVWGCDFYTSTTLPDPYPDHPCYASWPTTPSQIPYNQGFAAVYLSRTIGLNIGFDGAEGTNRNKVYNMRNGIILRDETVSDISGTDFYDFEGLIPTVLPDPLLDLNQHAINMVNVTSNIRDNTMDNLMVGVYGIESANEIIKNTITLSTPSPGFGFTRGIELLRPQKAIIKQNAIDEGMRAIVIQDVVNNFLIEKNDLTTSFYFGGISTRILIRNAKMDPAEGIILDNELVIADALASTGIHLVNVNRIMVEDNDVTFQHDENHLTRGIIGVGTYRSTIHYNDIYRSEADEIGGNHGIQVENSGFNTVFCNTMENFWINLHMFGANSQTRLNSNTFYESEYGLGLTPPVMLGIQRHHGNQWPDSYNSFAAYIFTDFPNIEAIQSQFIVDQVENADFMPNPVGPSSIAGVWFKNFDNPNPTLTCVVDPTPIANADTLSKLIRTELIYDEFNDEMTWIMKSDIFDMILAEPGLTSNTVLDSFYNAEENTALGKLVAWQKGLTSRFGEEKVLKALTLDTISFLSEDIVYIDSILALSPNDSVTWLTLRALKADTLEKEVAELKVYLDDEESDSQDEYEVIADDLDILTSTNDLEAYLKEALLFKTQYLLGAPFSSSDSTDLSVLAGLCPWEGGRAQAVGQELYSTITNLMILPSMDNCPAPRTFIALPEQQATYEGDIFSVTPNPVLENAEIKCDDVITQITVFNAEMKPVYRVQPMQRQWSVNMSKLASGVYIVSVSTINEKFAQRIIRM